MDNKSTFICRYKRDKLGNQPKIKSADGILHLQFKSVTLDTF